MDYNSVGGSYSQASTANYGPVNAPPLEESTSRIRDAVGVTEQILSALHDAIAMLEKRLDTVVMPVPPSVVSAAAPGKAPTVPMSHLLGRIGILNEGFDHAAQRLRELTRRVEV